MLTTVEETIESIRLTDEAYYSQSHGRNRPEAADLCYLYDYSDRISIVYDNFNTLCEGYSGTFAGAAVKILRRCWPLLKELGSFLRQVQELVALLQELQSKFD
jgi:hypothetical protein